MTTQRLTGRCHCGGVSFSLPASSAGIICCHCEDCRKMHGNYNAFLAAPAEEVTFSSDETLVWYQSGQETRRAFCKVCGGRVLKENTAQGRWLVSAGLIDGLTGKKIVRNVWEQSKGDWYDLPTVAT